ncbi:hypothetical protein [Polynucleobacter necessarius]|uniref:hypothetical protein n=1 Tax=Polynucleobacter necessarius TaxID=576610 RepID=UPI001E315BCD|nr:hypothetical protein [Polynucleobacter necessarius]
MTASPRVRSGFLSIALACCLLLMVGCASRPINPPLDKIDLKAGYRGLLECSGQGGQLPETLVVLAFSGGGTRAASIWCIRSIA